MHRPVMNPSFLLELDAPKRRPGRLASFRRVLGWAWRALLFEPFGFLRRQRTRIEVGTPFARLCRAVLYRLIGLPVIVVAIAAVLVFNGTHPPIVPPTTDPQTLGVYHDPVTFLADDGMRLEAWLIPVIDAKRVIEEKEAVIRRKSPAVVLVHDYGATREQMLPLVHPLHDAGFTVLVMSLRGSDSRTPAGQTFGLSECGDVRAGVDVLRRRPNIDTRRIVLIGVGTGATASLLAAQQDGGIAALVLENPLTHSEDVLAHIAPAQPWLKWMRPTCKWAFDLAYGVDADDVDLRRLQGVMNARPCLMLDNGAAGPVGLKRYAVDQVVQFLKSRVSPPDAAVAATAQQE